MPDNYPWEYHHTCPQLCPTITFLSHFNCRFKLKLSAQVLWGSYDNIMRNLLTPDVLPLQAAPTPGPRYSDNACQVYIQLSNVWKIAEGQWASPVNLVSHHLTTSASSRVCKAAISDAPGGFLHIRGFSSLLWNMLCDTE